MQLEDTLKAHWPTIHPVATAIAEAPRQTIRPGAGVPDTIRRAALTELLDEGALHAFEAEDLVLEETLGKGGMGIVRLGTQRSLGRKVAVKTLRDGVADDRDAMVRLMREAWVTGAVEHPNVMPIYDVGFDAQGRPLVILKRIEGTDWAELLADEAMVMTRFGIDDVLSYHLKILMQVCHAVAFAHSRGIVHRDLKPDNVRIGAFGEVYVLDWGLAVSLQDDGSGRFPLAAQARELAGTPCYMAPEMVGGDMPPVSERTDVYLLGAMLFEIVCGHPPHRGSDLVTIMRSIMLSNPALPEHIPSLLQAIVRRCMQPVPEDRYGSAEEVRGALEQYLERRGSLKLSARAEQTLARLEGLLESGIEDEAEQRVIVYDRFGECRFGFQQALEIWEGNDEARQGLQRAARRVIDYELARGDARAADSLYRSLYKPLDSEQGALSQRIAEGMRLQTKQEQRLRALKQLGRQLDGSIGARKRATMALLVGACWSAVPLAYELIAGVPYHRSYGVPLAFNALVLLLGSAFALSVRASIRKTAVDRRAFSAILLVPVSIMLTLAAGWMAGMPAKSVVPLCLMVFGLVLGTSAIMMDLWAALPALINGVALLVCYRYLAQQTAIIAGFNLLTTGSLLFIWLPACSPARRAIERRLGLRRDTLRKLRKGSADAAPGA